MKKRFFTSLLLIALVGMACQVSAPVPVEPPATMTPPPSPTFTPPPTATATSPPTPTPVPGVRITSGESALFNGDWEKALAEFDAALNASSDQDTRMAALLGSGQAWLLGRDYSQAIRVFEQAVNEQPDSPRSAEAYFFLGQAYSGAEFFYDAAQAYLDYMIRRSGVIDAYVLDRRADALFAAGDYAGAATDFQAAWLSPSQLDSTLLQLKLARALAVSGDASSAISLYDDLLLKTNDPNTRALIGLRKGQAYLALGMPEEAYRVYLDAVNNYPTAYESYLALIELVDAGVPVDELQRGKVDYFAGQYGVALAAFDRYLQNNPVDPGEAYYFYGLTTRALGGYEEALTYWDKVISGYPEHRLWDDAYEQKAYTQWAFLDRYPEAVGTLLDFAGRAPDHLRAGEFLFDAAQVTEIDGQLTQAAELFEKVVNLYPGYEQAQRALFLAGLTHYRLGDFQTAMNSFLRYQGLVTSLYDRAAASFWIGKTQLAAGDQGAARATWETTAGIDPTGYYSERARDILFDRQPFTPPQSYDIAYDAATERLQAEDWLRSTYSLPPDTDLSGLGPLADNPNLMRGTELWRLGLYNEARSEFEVLRQSIAADVVHTYRLANYMAELGLYRSAIIAARQVLTLALFDDAMTMSAPAYFNHLRFGTYYADLLIPESQDYGFHPLFTFSVLRQESLFEGFVRSTAGARGLMQIIPATGAEIATNLGWPPNYSDQDLYRPLVSIRFGIAYLDKQRDYFDGNLYATLAAYNGGPGNSAAWLKLAPDDPDLFLELIRFEETRNYIRGIYEVFSIYRFLYDRTP